MIKKYLHYAVAAAFAAASTASNVAVAVEETANDSFAMPQHLDTVDGQVTVTGVIGVAETSTPVVPDIDYYSFHGYANNIVTIDIDFGFKGAAFSATNPAGERNLDTIIGIWGPPPATLETPRFFLPSDDTGTGDADSIPILNSNPPIYRDARLDGIVLPATGTYTVGVTSGGVFQTVPRTFLDDGSATAFISNSLSNGRYTLIISGVSAPVVQPPAPPPVVQPPAPPPVVQPPAPPAVQAIAIDIRPGVDRLARIDPKSRGVIPVALLSSEGFDARNVDSGSVRFGPTGKEATALRCTKRGVDVNHDRARDMVCIFDNQATRFDPSHDKGKITGTIAGKQFQGEGWLKVIPVKRKHKDRDDRGRHHGRDHDGDDD
jgi:hypothetical protein